MGSLLDSAHSRYQRGAFSKDEVPIGPALRRVLWESMDVEVQNDAQGW